MEIQWLGHAAFKVTFDGAQVLFDPFLNGNPSFKGDFDSIVKGTTHILVTHAHNDHVGDAIEIMKRTGATLVSTPEICGFIGGFYSDAKCHGMNLGGTASVGAVEVTMTRAHHSSSFVADDGRIFYGGEPSGLIARVGGRSVYHMGDTCAFSDMALIDELHSPEIGIAPIGDGYTMGPREAALAVDRWFHFKVAIPCHWGTFPVLVQSPEAFVRAVKKSEVWAPNPMDSRKF